jgi:hypothetical protein
VEEDDAKLLRIAIWSMSFWRDRCRIERQRLLGFLRGGSCRSAVA